VFGVPRPLAWGARTDTVAATNLTCQMMVAEPVASRREGVAWSPEVHEPLRSSEDHKSMGEDRWAVAIISVALA
jgi:hypothetical protein